MNERGYNSEFSGRVGPPGKIGIAPSLVHNMTLPIGGCGRQPILYVDLWGSPDTSKPCQTLQYASSNTLPCILKGLAGVGGAWEPPEVNMLYWLPTTSSYGKGHIVNEGGYNSDFSEGSDPPPRPKDPGFLESSSRSIDWRGQIAKQRSATPQKICGPVGSLNWAPKNLWSCWLVKLGPL